MLYVTIHWLNSLRYKFIYVIGKYIGAYRCLSIVCSSTVGD